MRGNRSNKFRTTNDARFQGPGCRRAPAVTSQRTAKHWTADIPRLERQSPDRYPRYCRDAKSSIPAFNGAVVPDVPIGDHLDPAADKMQPLLRATSLPPAVSASMIEVSCDLRRAAILLRFARDRLEFRLCLGAEIAPWPGGRPLRFSTQIPVHVAAVLSGEGIGVVFRMALQENKLAAKTTSRSYRRRSLANSSRRGNRLVQARSATAHCISSAGSASRDLACRPKGGSAPP